MNRIEKLEAEIAILREKLNSEIMKEQENRVPSKEVLRISRKLDKLILRYQTFLMEKKK